MADTNLIGWPTVTEAAKELSRSPRSIWRDIEEGKIEAKKRPRPGLRPETVCNPDDIERLHPAAHVMRDEPETALTTRDPRREMAALELLTALARQTTRNAPPKRWLNTTEAVEHSGLSPRLLRREARRRRLLTVRDPELKFERDSLDRWQPEKEEEEETLTLAQVAGIDNDARNLARGDRMLKSISHRDS